MRIALRQRNSAAVCDLVAEGAVACGVSKGGQAAHGLETIPIGRDELVVVQQVLGTLAPPAGEFGSLAAQRSAVLTLGAPVIIARGAVEDFVQLGKLAIVPVVDGCFERSVHAVVRRADPASEDAQAFIDTACQVGLQLL